MRRSSGGGVLVHPICCFDDGLSRPGLLSDSYGDGRYGGPSCGQPYLPSLPCKVLLYLILLLIRGVSTVFQCVRCKRKVRLPLDAVGGPLDDSGIYRGGLSRAACQEARWAASYAACREATASWMPSQNLWYSSPSLKTHDTFEFWSAAKNSLRGIMLC